MLSCPAESGGVVQMDVGSCAHTATPPCVCDMHPSCGSRYQLDQPVAFFAAAYAFLRAERLLP